MKKAFAVLASIFLAGTVLTSATASEPTSEKRNVNIYYYVQDSILKAQNSDGNMAAAKNEFENDVKEYYGKRFNVQSVQPYPQDMVAPEKAEKFMEENKDPFIITIELEGTGVRTEHYQNAYGAQSEGISPTVKVHLKEGDKDISDNKVYAFDYGTVEYGKGTFALGRDIFVVDKDPRRNVKDSVKARMRDACTFNMSGINEYANPFEYSLEVARFKGDFKTLTEVREKYVQNLEMQIHKFENWMKDDPVYSVYYPEFEKFSDQQKLVYINGLIQAGIYKVS